MDLDKQRQKEHALFSPSAAERWTNCPGSIGLSEFIPSEFIYVSPAATAGTHAHDVLERRLKGENVEGFPAEYQNAASTVECWIKLRFANWKDYTRIVEERVYSGEFFGIDNALLFGKTDIAMINLERLELIVLDFKYGTKKVEPKHNKQLLIYMVGAFIKHFIQNDACPEITSFRDISKMKLTIGILQPRVNDGMRALSLDLQKKSDFDFFKSFIKLVKVSYKSAMELRELFETNGFSDDMREEKATIDSCNAVGSLLDYMKWEEYFSYGNHCYFCPCKPVCPAYKQNTIDAFEDSEAGGVVSMDVNSWFEDESAKPRINPNRFSSDVIEGEIDIF